jgi:hypothetical protein
MANKTIKVAGKAIEFTVETVKKSTVKFADGVIGELPTPASGVVSIAAATKLYQEVKASAPVVIKPIKTISKFDFSALRDGVEGETLQFKPDVYKDRLDLENMKNVTLLGDGKVSFETGRRAIQLNNNNVNGLTIAGFNFQNIDDYIIDVWGSGQLKYTGKDGSFINGLNLLNNTADNCGTMLHIDGGVEKGINLGVIKGLVIGNNTFKNSAKAGNAFYVGNAQGYDVYGNVCDNMNTEINNHNAIFQLNGFGKFHHNKITNHQGNALRAWLNGVDGDTVEIFHNVVWNSRKYGAFELQLEPNQFNNGAKGCNGIVYNNTVGRMNTSLDWEGQILDKYTLGEGKSLQFKDNLGFELNYVPDGSKPKETKPLPLGRNMVNYDDYAQKDGNRYFNTATEAVNDLTTFKSKFAGIGAQ